MVQITDIVYEMNLTGFSGDLDDIADGTTYGKVLQTALDSGQIDLGGAGITGNLPATALVEGVQPFVSNITFVPKVGDTHDSISWGAGTITFSDGSSLAIDAGSFDNQTEVTHWIYFTIGSSSLSTTTTYSDCVGDNRGPLCLYAVSSDATQQVLIRPFYSKGLNIQADVIAALAIQTLHLAAEAVTADKIEAGTITADRLSFTPFVIGTDDLDDVGDGTTYSRVLTTDITAGHILLSAATGDLDDISDGTSYGRVDITDIQSGHIILSTVIGDLDDIDEGTNYGKVAITDIQSGHILLSTTIGDLDDIDDGTSYGRVDITDIQSGHIILSTTIGDLDDVDDGTTYGKVAVTDISAGKIKLTTSQDMDSQGFEIISNTGTTRVEITDVHVAGYDADVLQFELRADTGKAQAGGGKVILDEDGVHIIGDAGAMLTIHKTGLGDPRGVVWNGTINGIENIILSDAALGYGAVVQAGSSYFQVKPGGSFYFFGTSLLPVSGSPDIGAVGTKFGNIWGTVKYHDLHLLDTRCPKCGELFKMDDNVKFTVIAVESLEDSQGTPYEQIRCLPVHVRCDPVKKLRRWLDALLCR